MSFFKNKNKKGFSVGEVVLSVFIVGTTLTVIAAVMAKTMTTFFEDRDSVIASGLAQEGIEIVRNIRDNEWLKGDEALDFDELFPSGVYVMNYGDNELSGDYSANDNNDGLEHSEGSDYRHDRSGTDSADKFSRRIYVTLNEDNEVEVVSLVSWDGNNFDFPSNVEVSSSLDGCTLKKRCVFVKSALTDWGGPTGTSE